MKKRLTMDFETRSCVDLKKAGAYKYSLDQTTQPTCFAFKKHGIDKMYFLDFEMVNTRWRKLPNSLRAIWLSAIHEEYEFSAHNAFFERCIYENILVKRLGWPHIPYKLYRCTAAKAAACSLPRNLEGAGAAMNLTIQKDKRGYAAMMATCKPTKQCNDWVKIQTDIRARKEEGKKLTPRQIKWLEVDQECPPVFRGPKTDPEVFHVLYEYCKIDVKAEEALDDALPDLIPIEQKVWRLNQKLNWRGLRIDIPVVKKAATILSSEAEIMKGELDQLTMGLIVKPGAIKSILEFLECEGVELENLRAKTVDDALKENVSGTAKRLLEIRKALSKASTKKYQAFLNRVNEDERVRDLTLYHGAGTGRDTGTGVQVHNLPRGLLKFDGRTYGAIEDVIDCTVDELKMLYGKNLSILFSSIIRNIIIPSPGHELYVADFSKVEVAVLWWLSDNTPGLKVLKDGLDPYKYMAMANTGKAYEKVSEEERQLGKAQVLGCGFGMGATKFQMTAWDMYRIKLTDEQSKEAVNSYRSANAAVKALWRTYEDAAAYVISKGDGVTASAGKCKFINAKGFLWIELPSGRRLAYRSPQIVMRETDYGPRPSIEFWGARGKHWRVERTWGGTLCENIVQAVARDLMMQGIVRLDKTYPVLFAVHDEAICERKIGEGNVDEFIKILCQSPKWAAGLPIEAKGWQGGRYRK